MKPSEDPTADLYKLMDEAGLNTSAVFDSKKSMSKIVTEIRGALAMKLKAYVVRRDHVMFNQGTESKQSRKIEVK